MKEKIKLILVVPPQEHLLEGFTNGLICLANYVGKHLPQVQVELLDLSRAALSEIDQRVISAKPADDEHLVVGITTLTAFYQSSLDVACSFKLHYPGCIVVFGGHHASAEAKTILARRTGLIDFIIVGEGEKAIVEFLLRLNTPTIYQSPSLAFYSDGKFQQNPSSNLLTQEELDQLPLYLNGEYRPPIPGKFDHATLVTARGCPLSCSFCAVANEKIRAKSVTQVMNDVRQMVSLGYKRIAIEDNFFAHSPRRTDELCAALVDLRQCGLDFSWDCQTRVESMTREGLVPKLEKAGCDAVYIGVESLCPDQLLFLNKSQHPDKYLNLLANVVVPRLMASKVNCYINLQLGLPSEDDGHIEYTLDSLRSLGETAHRQKREITVFPMLFVVYPGTAHFRQGLAKGQFWSEVFEDFTEWEVRQRPVLTWLGEHFAHGTGGIPIGILNDYYLRHQHFVINSSAIFRISTTLTRMAQIPGIRVFSYGKYLIRTEVNNRENLDLKTPILITASEGENI